MEALPLYIIIGLFCLAIIAAYVVPNKKISDDKYDQKMD